MMGPVLILGTRTHGMPMLGEVKSSSQLRFPLSVAKIARVVIVFVCVCLCVSSFVVNCDGVKMIGLGLSIAWESGLDPFGFSGAWAGS